MAKKYMDYTLKEKNWLHKNFIAGCLNTMPSVKATIVSFSDNYHVLRVTAPVELRSEDIELFTDAIKTTIQLAEISNAKDSDNEMV